MKNIFKNMKKNYLYGIIGLLIIIAIVLAIMLYKKREEYITANENNYNFAFYELIDYVENVENYLAKSMISSTSESGAENLTRVWKEANLASVYLSNLPVSSNELSNTAKFLNQVSDYSYSLSRKSIYNQDLSQEELDNIRELYDYSIQLKNTLNQLYTDMQDR